MRHTTNQSEDGGADHVMNLRCSCSVGRFNHFSLRQTRSFPHPLSASCISRNRRLCSENMLAAFPTFRNAGVWLLYTERLGGTLILKHSAFLAKPLQVEKAVIDPSSHLCFWQESAFWCALRAQLQLNISEGNTHMLLQSGRETREKSFHPWTVSSNTWVSLQLALRTLSVHVCRTMNTRVVIYIRSHKHGCSFGVLWCSQEWPYQLLWRHSVLLHKEPDSDL